MLKRIFILTLLVLPACAPPEPQLPPEAAQLVPEFDRVAVTDTLIAACPTFTYAEINTLVILCEQDRLDGWSKSDMLQNALWTCAPAVSTPRYSHCMSCYTSVVEQICGP